MDYEFELLDEIVTADDKETQAASGSSRTRAKRKFDAEKSRWSSEIEARLNDEDIVEKRKRTFVRRIDKKLAPDGPEIKFAGSDWFEISELPEDSSMPPIAPVFIDPTDYYKEVAVKQEPSESQPCDPENEKHEEPIRTDALENENEPHTAEKTSNDTESSLVNIESSITSKDIPEPLEDTSIFEPGELSSDDGLEDNFEFIPPWMVSKHEDRRKKPKIAPAPVVIPETTSSAVLNEILQDPDRLPGGFKRGKYGVRDHSGVPYCKYCDTIFLKRKDLNEHYPVCPNLQCEDPTMYTCRVCKKNLKKVSFLKHRHDGGKCAYCGKQLMNPRDLKAHIKNRHKGAEYKPPVYDDDREEKYIQEKLQKEGDLYEKRLQILAHNMEKNGPKSHPCKTCGESFRNPRTLANHSKIHDREMYPCELCGKLVTSIWGLRSHQEWVHKIPKVRTKTYIRQSKVHKEANEIDVPMDVEAADKIIKEVTESKNPEVWQDVEMISESVEELMQLTDLEVKIPTELLVEQIKPNEWNKYIQQYDDPKLSARAVVELDRLTFPIDWNKVKALQRVSRETKKSADSLSRDSSPDIFHSPSQLYDICYETDSDSDASEHSAMPPSHPQNYDDDFTNDYDSSAAVSVKQEQSEESDESDESEPPVKRKRVQRKAGYNYNPASLLPGNILPGTYKIRNCTGLSICKFCDTMFANRKEKQAHECEYLKCSPGKYICKVCKKELSRKSFANHYHDLPNCQYCGKSFMSPRDMKYHLEEKHPNEDYKAPIMFDEETVENYIKDKIKKEAHIYELREKKKRKKAAVGDLYICDYCGAQELTKKTIGRHIMIHIKRTYNCDQCFNVFDSRNAYYMHRVIHTRRRRTNRAFHCELCGKNFNTQENLQTHQKNIHGKGLKCETCKIPLTREELNNHMKSVHGEIPCKICAKIYLIPSKLKEHEMRHLITMKCNTNSTTNEIEMNDLQLPKRIEVMTCEYCAKEFPTATAMKRHQASKHQVGIICDVCKEPMESKAALKEHMKTHGSFNCEICSKSFIGPSQLKSHLKRHTKIDEGNRVECSFCPKDFFPDRMHGHVYKFHKENFDEWLANIDSNPPQPKNPNTNRKPKFYKCNVCLTKFNSQTSYEHHIKTHSINGGKDHRCSCGKSFTFALGLKAHQIRAHEIGITCETCKVPLDNRDIMLKHMENVHGPIPCQFCSKMFLIPSKLKMHESIHVPPDLSKRMQCEFCPKNFKREFIRRHIFRLHQEEFEEWSDRNKDIV